MTGTRSPATRSDDQIVVLRKDLVHVAYQCRARGMTETASQLEEMIFRAAVVAPSACADAIRASKERAAPQDGSSGAPTRRCLDSQDPTVAAPVVSSPTAAPSGYKLVRADVLEWLHGEAPNPETGEWFERPSGEGAYWWRSRLRLATITPSTAAVASSETQEERILRLWKMLDSRDAEIDRLERELAEEKRRVAAAGERELQRLSSSTAGIDAAVEIVRKAAEPYDTDHGDDQFIVDLLVSIADDIAALKKSLSATRVDTEQVVGRVHNDKGQGIAVLNSIGRELPDGAPLYSERCNTRGPRT